MKKSFTVYGNTTVEYNHSEVNSEQVVKAVIDWCEKYNVYGNESFQSDDLNIYAPDLICEIIDILGFEIKSEI